MRILARAVLRDFWEKHPDAEQPLKSWWQEASGANWSSPSDIKSRYAGASIVADNRVVFNIAGNKYRLVVHFNYPFHMGLIKFIGTHADYDRIDVTKVQS